MLEARRLDLERADPVPGRDDHVVGAALVPDVPVLVHAGGVLRVEPLAAEGLARRLLVVPVPERVVRVRPRAEADLAALARRHRLLVLVEDRDVPARHRAAHRSLPHLHEREVPAQRVALREAVVVEDGDPVLVAEPADRLRVQRLPGGADDPELLGVARPRVVDSHHRADRGGGAEDVRHPVLREERELLVRVEAALALVDDLHRAVAPRAEEGRDAGGPCPLAHPVEALAVLDVVAELELVVPEQVPVRVEDPLREAGRPRRVVELGRVVGRRVDRRERRVARCDQRLVEDEDVLDGETRAPGRARRSRRS